MNLQYNLQGTKALHFVFVAMSFFAAPALAEIPSVRGTVAIGAPVTHTADAVLLASSEDTAEQQLWASIRVTQDPLQVLLFLRAYPNSTHVEEARAMLAMVMETKDEPQTDDEAAKTTPAVAASPDVGEKDLIERAQKSGLAEDYTAYLGAYPNGVYAELARYELAAITSKTAAEVEAAAPVPETTPSTVTTKLPVNITFTSPLTTGGPGIEGLSIEQLVTGSPLFPPIEGIPDSLWKGQKCTACHSWTREALCTQGGTYNASADNPALKKRHPYGGTFKQSLKIWAADSCR